MSILLYYNIENKINIINKININTKKLQLIIKLIKQNKSLKSLNYFSNFGLYNINNNIILTDNIYEEKYVNKIINDYINNIITLEQLINFKFINYLSVLLDGPKNESNTTIEDNQIKIKPQPKKKYVIKELIIDQEKSKKCCIIQ